MVSVSVFSIQYTAVEVRQATVVSLPPARSSSSFLPATTFVSDGMASSGGSSQVVPWTP